MVWSIACTWSSTLCIGPCMYPCPMNSQSALCAAWAMEGYDSHTMPLMANVGVIPRCCNASKIRQNPDRIPYSCQDQFGRSGIRGCPIGGGNTVLGMVLSIDQCSTFTMIHTSILLSSGICKRGLSTMARNGALSLSNDFFVSIIVSLRLERGD